MKKSPQRILNPGGFKRLTVLITTKSVSSFILFKWWGVVGERRRMSVKEQGWGSWCETGSDSYAHLCMIQTEADRCLENLLENGQNFTVPRTFV